MNRERPGQRPAAETSPNQQPILLFGDQQVTYTIAADGGPVAEEQHAITVAVDDLQDREVIQASVRAELEKQFWFLSTEFQGEELREKFSIQLADGVAIQLYNFREDALLSGEVEKIAGALKKYYDALRDKTQWRVESVQVRSKDVPNPLNGEPYYGMSNEEQHRFELYPASFGKGRYDDDLDVSSLEAVVLHEPSHVNFQHVWQANAAMLGWEIVEDVLLELPGGERTIWYNATPKDCPTDYAALYPYEDIPESVAMWFLAPEQLSATRREIVERLFTRDGLSENAAPQVTQVMPQLPTAPHVSIRVTQKQNRRSLFGVVQAVAAPEKPVVSLEEYRKLRAPQK